jgi:hypothetical protein
MLWKLLVASVGLGQWASSKAVLLPQSMRQPQQTQQLEATRWQPVVQQPWLLVGGTLLLQQLAA